MDREHPEVFITWAHADPSWTAHESKQWEATVNQFAELLVENGFDTELDLWHHHELSVDWTRWGARKVAFASKRIIAISSAWADRWTGSNAPTVGAGAVSEADQLRGEFQKDQADFQRRTLIAVLPGMHANMVPADLARLNRFEIRTLDQRGMESLIRALTDQPRRARPAIGVKPNYMQSEGVRENTITTVPVADPLITTDELVDQLELMLSESSEAADGAVLISEYREARHEYDILRGPASRESVFKSIHKLNLLTARVYGRTLNSLHQDESA